MGWWGRCQLFGRCTTLGANTLHVLAKETVHLVTVVRAGPKWVTATTLLANTVEIRFGIVGTTKLGCRRGRGLLAQCTVAMRWTAINLGRGSSRLGHHHQ